MKKFTIYNLQFTTRRKAFTLMEILVTAMIFAAIMIIATAVLAQSSTFRIKLSEIRKTSEEARRLADQITRDVRSANSPIKIESGSAPSTIITVIPNGLALVFCNRNPVFCVPKNSITPPVAKIPDPSDLSGSMVLLLLPILFKTY